MFLLSPSLSSPVPPRNQQVGEITTCVLGFNVFIMIAPGAQKGDCVGCRGCFDSVRGAPRQKFINHKLNFLSSFNTYV